MSAVIAVSFFEEERSERASPLCPFPRDTCPEITAPNPGIYKQGPGPGINNATKYVASNTLHSHEWKKSVFFKGDVAEEVSKLKQQDGRVIFMYGSGNLIQTLLKHDLIDAFWLKICPMTLGTGKRLFAEGTSPAAFKVSKSQVSPTGVIVANLERAGEVQTGTVGEEVAGEPCP